MGVEWEFLIASLRNRGFDEQLVRWIRECIVTTTYRVVVNGERSTVIRSTRGIRQGDPLSPYVFILLADVLSRNIEQETQVGRLKGVVLRRRCPELHHMFFVDD